MTTGNDQVVLVASFDTAHCKEETWLFMDIEREVLWGILVLQADAARHEAEAEARRHQQEEVAPVATKELKKEARGLRRRRGDISMRRGKDVAEHRLSCTRLLH
jgi:hypothetical protein